MTKDEKRYELASIEPIAPAPDADEGPLQLDRVDRVGFAAAAAAGTPPAVGVAAERVDEPVPETPTEPAGPQRR